MLHPRLHAAFVVTLACATIAANVGCMHNSDNKLPKLVTLSLRHDGKGDQSFYLICNGRKISHEDSPTFLPAMYESLHEGDCLVINFSPEVTVKWFVEQIERLLSEKVRRELDRDAKHVSVRFVSPKKGHADLYIDTPDIFWWFAPFKDPRDHKATLYFWNKDFLGKGDEGFDKVLEKISEQRPRTIGVIGSDYDSNTGFSFHEIPYWSREAELTELLQQTNSTTTDLDLAPATSVPPHATTIIPKDQLPAEGDNPLY